MWSMFVASVLAGALFLYLPSLLLLWGFRLPCLTALVCAPLVSISVYCLLCMLYAQANVFNSWVMLALPLLFLGFAALVVEWHCGRSSVIRFGVAYSPDVKPHVGDGRWWRSDWAVLGLYVVIGLVVSTVCFVFVLDGPDSFVREYDNVHHLGVTVSFVESGNWSPFAASLYATEADVVISPLPGLGFYPTAWNCMTALLVSFLGVSSPLAANAVNFLFVGVVLPVSMFSFMKVLFPKSLGIVVFGSLCTLGFSAFPWMLMVFGPLYPNMIAFCMLPAVAFCFISLFSQGVGRSARVAAGILFCLGILCCAFAQPNAVFTVAVFLIPFCVRQAVRAFDFISVPSDRKRLVQIACGMLACVLIAAIWFALYKAPFLQSVVSHSWPAITSKPQAFLDALGLGFRSGGMQIVLAGFVVVGMLYTLRHRAHLWLSCSYALAGLLYVVSASSDGPLQHLLTGFWYTDSFRVAASAVLCAIPLASMGLWAAVQACARVVNRMAPQTLSSRILVCSACAVSLAFVLGNYYPGVAIARHGVSETSLGFTLSSLQWQNDEVTPTVYDADERAFVQCVKDTVDSDALLLNVPDDGSAFAYGADGVRIYYRYLRTYGESDETEDSKLIRNHLAEISSNESVRDAVRNVGGEYLLVLDQGESRLESPRLFTYEDGSNWTGIEAVTDTTPGFEVVLSEGDMRLYRITAV